MGIICYIVTKYLIVKNNISYLTQSKHICRILYSMRYNILYILKYRAKINMTIKVTYLMRRNVILCLYLISKENKTHYGIQIIF